MGLLVFVSGPFQSHAQTSPQQNAKFGPNIKEPGWVWRHGTVLKASANRQVELHRPTATVERSITQNRSPGSKEPRLVHIQFAA